MNHKVKARVPKALADKADESPAAYTRRIHKTHTQDAYTRRIYAHSAARCTSIPPEREAPAVHIRHGHAHAALDKKSASIHNNAHHRNAVSKNAATFFARRFLAFYANPFPIVA